MIAPLLPSLYTGLAIGALLLGNALIPQQDPVPRAVQQAPGPVPVLATLEPTAGALTGGETITITGSELAAVTEVEVGGMPAELVTRTDGAITALVPNSPEYRAGDVDVTVRAGTVTVPADVSWTYSLRTPVDRQLAYAFEHWDDYNLAYFGDFNEWGGDCMNFVSQTLVARGWTPTDDWFNNAQQEWAPAFVHVPSFDEWLAGHPEYGASRFGLERIDDVKLGDIVMFDWEGDGSLDHAQVVSRIRAGDDGPTIQMVGHNLDSTYRSIDDALEEQGTPSATVTFWSIPL